MGTTFVTNQKTITLGIIPTTCSLRMHTNQTTIRILRFASTDSLGDDPTFWYFYPSESFLYLYQLFDDCLLLLLNKTHPETRYP